MWGVSTSLYQRPCILPHTLLLLSPPPSLLAVSQKIVNQKFHHGNEVLTIVRWISVSSWERDGHRNWPNNNENTHTMEPRPVRLIHYVSHQQSPVRVQMFSGETRRRFCKRTLYVNLKKVPFYIEISIVAACKFKNTDVIKQTFLFFLHITLFKYLDTLSQ